LVERIRPLPRIIVERKAMTATAKSLVIFVTMLHVAFFVVEALLWSNPSVSALALSKLNGDLSVSLPDQAASLKNLFINQGFYNLFLALAGVVGLLLIGRGRRSAGYALVGYMCLSALGAGLVLAASTTAYAGAFVQAVPACAALIVVARSFASVTTDTPPASS
jgi:putative membrane protein